MFELLISEGHAEQDLWNHSGEKLELLFGMAMERKTREGALQEMRWMLGAQIAIAACIDDTKAPAAFEKRLKELQELGGLIEKKTPRAARAELAGRLKSLGAKVR